ncbi:D-alanine--D-alanine ligase [Candidatus Providencia siddallii]|uniref:D-alanine--D-alanine ligase n=1 Tax=Candidatus Providencia siddallii TaxID=1715285 RepID=A0ABM9NP21_9GAMM
MIEKIAVLFGGTSAERKISIKSGNSILKTLHEIGINAYPIDTKYFPLITLKRKGFNKVFIALHGKEGEDGTIQGMLEILKIPYTGSNVISSAIGMNKLKCKQIWKGAGLNTAPFFVITKNEYKTIPLTKFFEHINFIGLPIVIKPNTGGSSIGAIKINNMNSLIPTFEKAFYFDNTLLIEKWLCGPEYTVAILNDIILPSIRIETQNNFFDYNAKYKSNKTKYFCPSGLTEILDKKLTNLAMNAYKTIGCSGCARIDILQDDNEEFYLLEINTSPGMTNHSLVPIAARQAGLSFSQLVLYILKLATLHATPRFNKPKISK